MKIQYLPVEILNKIFRNLSVADLLTAKQVCHKWCACVNIILPDDVTVMAAEDIGWLMEDLQQATVPFKHWVFKTIDLSGKRFYEDFWQFFTDEVKSLSLIDVEITEKLLLMLLISCRKLEYLCLAGFSHIFLTGTFLSNEEDIDELSRSLSNVTSLRLSCSRYLSDLLFSRISRVVGPLTELCLAGCQISYQNSIYKRFYPSDGRIVASDHVFTFKFILKFIETKKKTLKKISLNRTGVDSESLDALSKIPGLELKTIHLISCDQLTKSGIQLLTRNQPCLVDIDISLCPRVTDYAVIAIADNLPKLRKLSLRRCQSITEVGMDNLSRLKYLEELDISHLEVRKWESIEVALGKVHRPMMRRLNVASLPIQWETVAAFPETMPNLVSLDMSRCVVGVNDRSIQSVCKSLIHLEFLSISGCEAVSDVGLTGHHISKDQIRTIPDITGNQLSLEALGIKENNPYKIELGLKAEQNIREQAKVRRFLEKNVDVLNSQIGGSSLSNLVKLRELNLCGGVRLSNITLCNAFNFKELFSVNLAHCQLVREEGLIEMAIHCPSLEVINLTDCSNTTDAVILVFSHRLKRIKSLDLQRCVLLTDDALDSLSSRTSLRYLDVSGCNFMTCEGVELIKKRILRLVNFHYRGLKSKQQLLDEGGTIEEPIVPKPPPLLSKLVRKLTR